MFTYVLSVAIGMFGITYASVPLYKVFCQATGFGGTTQRLEDGDERLKKMTPVEDSRVLTVYFSSNVSNQVRPSP